jgi:pimeloyl-ACP methyl ester carboxylesterase
MLERRVVLSNGRKIAVRESGPANGRPVFYLHGFLGSRLECVPADPLAAEFGLRLISIDRPGFGLSSSAPPDPAIDAADAAAVCSELGLLQPIIVGVSGGSAPALLMAANPAVGAQVVILACPLCPLDDPAVLAQFSTVAQLVLNGTTLTPRTAGFLLDGPLRQFAKRYPQALLRILCTRFAHADQEALRSGEWSQAIASSLAESFAAGGHGELRDLLTYTQRWDERLWKVQTPVLIWHGRQDTVVPIQCARALARRLANGQLHEYENEGHLSVPLRHMRPLLSQAIRLDANSTATKPAIH